MTDHMTIYDLIEIEAQGGKEDLLAFIADPLAVIAKQDGPVLFPKELSSGSTGD